MTVRRIELAEVVLHPLSLAALALLLINDNLVKTQSPGLVSGKQSGVAGMALMPIVLFGLAIVATEVSGCLPRPGRRAAAACIGLVAVAYAAVELWPVATDAYRWTWGLLQWPGRALAAMAAGNPVAGVRPVAAWADASDLLALPAGLALAVILRRAARPRDEAPRMRRHRSNQAI